MNGIERAVEIFGAIAKGAVSNLARAIGRSPQEVSKWLKRGWAPAKYCGAIASAVTAAIPLAKLYGLDPEVARPVTLKDLNPDLPEVVAVVPPDVAEGAGA